MVDECHHISTFKGQYAALLDNLTAPMRLGLTATLPYQQEAKMALEGYIGPVIGELSMVEAAEKEILANVKVKLIKAPLHKHSRDLRRYHEVYDSGIVNNRTRNRLVMETAKKYIDSGETVLIFVTKIDHGKNLVSLANDVFGLDVEFVWGHTTKETRTSARLLLRKKRLSCVIATVVWKEGVNIPSLGVVINAAGGKSEIATIQAVGRGLRRTTDKEFVTLVDFFDISHHYLVGHSGLRVCLFFDEGWM
jgi:superfamily II DNA or RNA helicase